MKKILVAAGTSQNKMNGVAGTIKSMCEARGVAVEVVAENLYEVDLDQVAPDLIVLMGVNQFQTEIPTVSGVPFLTKMGMDQAIDDIIKRLQS
ncbi:hypothetical protein ACI7RC_10435 [Brevibacillus sp. B_LB10_24]|uniref:hypothetical protein n=1 Tax=Brevibacillus sp. B_LB10_24 TaxID=3380645 RepID=UPI0038BC9D53